MAVCVISILTYKIDFCQNLKLLCLPPDLCFNKHRVAISGLLFDLKISGVNHMAKSQDAKKDKKKAPLKTPEQKRAEKREKKKTGTY
jgi:hypothetical protein